MRPRPRSAARRWPSACWTSGVKGGSIIFPNTTTLGNVEVNNRITAAFTATVATLAVAGKLGNFKVDAGPENIGIDVDANNIVGSVVSLIESRGDVVGVMGANGFVTPAIGDAVAQLKMGDKICSYGFDLGPKQQEQIKTGALDGALGQQPFLQGFWPVMQLYPPDRPRHLGGQSRHARAARDQGQTSTRSASATRTEPVAAPAGADAGRAGGAAFRPLRRLRLSAGRSGSWSSWCCSMSLGTSINPRFFGDLTALQSVLRDASRYGVMAVGMTFVIVNRDLDLSVGSTLGLVAVAVLDRLRADPFRPAGLGRGPGLPSRSAWRIGLVNGVLVTWLKVPSFIATLTMLFIGRGLVLGLTGGKTIAYEVKAREFAFFAPGRGQRARLQQPDPGRSCSSPSSAGSCSPGRAGATRPTPSAATSRRPSMPASTRGWCASAASSWPRCAPRWPA